MLNWWLKAEKRNAAFNLSQGVVIMKTEHFHATAQGASGINGITIDNPNGIAFV